MDLIDSSLHRYYRAMQKKYPDILWFGDETRRELALTFDDGPHLRDTPRVLERLAEYEIPATFFLVGKHAERHPGLVKQIHHSGHQIGIHCYRHLPFPLQRPVELHEQLDRTRKSIAHFCGIAPETLTALRPPYGAFTKKTLTHLMNWHYQVVLWNNIPPHWMQPLSWTTRQIFNQVRPGSVIVLHDGHGHGKKAANIIDIVVPKLKALGYNFVTVNNLKRISKHES